MITPKGKGFAFMVIDYSHEHDLLFTVAITETGEIWTFSNKEFRFDNNVTMGRTNVSKTIPPAKNPAPTV